MPGLAGIYTQAFDPKQLDDQIRRMIRSMMHHDWYHVDICTRPPFAAASIMLDVAAHPNRQPASTADGTVLVWMDGQLYDYNRRNVLERYIPDGKRDHSGGDAQLIALLYESLGEKCFKTLDGTYAVALYDTSKHRSIVAVDRCATRPLYYCADKSFFTYASEVKAILQYRRFKKRVNEQAVAEFFSFRHVLADRTLCEDIYCLPAGCYAEYQNGRLDVRPYIQFDVTKHTVPETFEAYVDVVADAVKTAVYRQTSENHTIGEMLSAGLDSRLLAAAMPSVNGRFHTFSRGPKDCWDVQFGARVARLVGSHHHHLELPEDFLLHTARQGVWVTDGLMTVNDLYMLGVIQEIKPHVDAVFLGIGMASGPLGGIEVDQGLIKAMSIEEVSGLLYRRYGHCMAEQFRRSVFRPDFFKRTQYAAYEGLSALLERYQQEGGVDRPYELSEMFWLKCRRPRSCNWGAYLSRTQIETRFPYNDPDLFDLVIRIPPELRLNRQMQIGVIKRIRADLADVPWDYTGIAASRSTPRQILARRAYFRFRKELEKLTGGVIPSVKARDRANYSDWYRTVLRPWLEDILLDHRTLDRGYFDPDGTRQMIGAHMSGRSDHSMQFGLMLTFELWNRLFMDGDAPQSYRFQQQLIVGGDS